MLFCMDDFRISSRWQRNYNETKTGWPREGGRESERTENENFNKKRAENFHLAL